MGERLKPNGPDAANWLVGPREIVELTSNAETETKTETETETEAEATPPGPTQPDSAPGRRSILTALRERGVPADKLRRLASDFLQTSEETLAGLALSVDDGDLDAVARAGHDLAGSSASFGATRLSAAARKVQSAAEAGDASDARALLPELADALDEARSSLLT